MEEIVSAIDFKGIFGYGSTCSSIDNHLHEIIHYGQNQCSEDESDEDEYCGEQESHFKMIPYGDTKSTEEESFDSGCMIEV